MTGEAPWTATPLQATDADIFVALSEAFNLEDGHPLSARASAAARVLAHGDPMARGWLVRERTKGSIAGYVVLSLSFSVEHGGRDAIIDEIYVLPDWRGRGLGRWLLAFAEEQARMLGVQTLHLEVERDNSRARKLYHSFGFDSLDRILMSKDLCSN